MQKLCFQAIKYQGKEDMQKINKHIQCWNRETSEKQRTK